MEQAQGQAIKQHQHQPNPGGDWETQREKADEKAGGQQMPVGNLTKSGTLEETLLEEGIHKNTLL